MLREVISRRIAHLGLTQGDVADALGWHQATVNKFINGRQYLTATHLDDLLVLLGAEPLPHWIPDVLSSTLYFGFAFYSKIQRDEQSIEDETSFVGNIKRKARERRHQQRELMRKMRRKKAKPLAPPPE
ncbi:helix-turn-helix transcriptional regulator [Planctomycetales bacterium ZRK34]|nr:helix-turn-helix transcriptional regulator [Planctomycetales bacterium ZRK34]